MLSLLLAFAIAEFVTEIPPPSEGKGVVCSAADTDDYSFNIYPARRLVHYPNVASPQRIPVVTSDAYFLDYEDVGGPGESISMLDRRRLTLTTTSKASYARFKYLQRQCRLVPTIDFNPPVRSIWRRLFTREERPKEVEPGRPMRRGTALRWEAEARKAKIDPKA